MQRLQPVTVVVGLPPGVEMPCAKRRRTVMWGPEDEAEALSSARDALSFSSATAVEPTLRPSEELLSEAVTVEELIATRGELSAEWCERLSALLRSCCVSTGTTTTAAAADALSTRFDALLGPAPSAEVSCAVLRQLSDIARAAPLVAMRFFPALVRVRFPGFLQHRLSELAASLLLSGGPAVPADLLSSLALVLVSNATDAATSALEGACDPIESLRRVFSSADCRWGIDVVNSTAKACARVAAERHFVLDALLAAMESAPERWSSFDVLFLLHLLGLAPKAGKALPLAKMHASFSSAAIRGTLSLETLLSCVRSACADGTIVFLLCDLLDGDADWKARQSEIPLTKWSSALLVDAFASRPHMRKDILDHVLRRLCAEYNSSAVCTAESTLAALAESHWGVFSSFRAPTVIGAWLVSNSKSVSLRAADTLCSIIAAQGDESAWKLALFLSSSAHVFSALSSFAFLLSLLFSSKTLTSFLGIVLFVQLFQQCMDPAPFAGLRCRALRRLLFFSLSSSEPLVSKEAIKGLSVVCDTLSFSEFQRVRDALAEFCGKATRDSTALSSEKALVPFAPKALVLSDFAHTDSAMARLSSSGTFPPLLECLYKYHQRATSESGFSSLEQLVESIVDVASRAQQLNLPPQTAA